MHQETLLLGREAEALGKSQRQLHYQLRGRAPYRRDITGQSRHPSPRGDFKFSAPKENRHLCGRHSGCPVSCPTVGQDPLNPQREGRRKEPESGLLSSDRVLHPQPPRFPAGGLGTARKWLSKHPSGSWSAEPGEPASRGGGVLDRGLCAQGCPQRTGQSWRKTATRPGCAASP